MIADRDETRPRPRGPAARARRERRPAAAHRSRPRSGDEPHLAAPRRRPPGATEPSVSSWFEPKPEVSAVGHEEPLPRSMPARPALTHDHFRTTVRAERSSASPWPAPGRTAAIEYLVVKAVAAAHSQLPELNLTRVPTAPARDHRRRRPGHARRGRPGRAGAPRRGPSALSTRPAGDRLAGEARAGRIPRRPRRQHRGLHPRPLRRSTTPSRASYRRRSPPLAIGGVRASRLWRAAPIVAGRTLTLTLSVDHDLVDDVLAARWLGVVAALLERPEWMHD